MCTRIVHESTPVRPFFESLDEKSAIDEEDCDTSDEEGDTTEVETT